MLPDKKPGVVFAAPVLPLDVGMIAARLEQAQLLEKLVTRWAFSPQEARWARSLGLPDSWTRRPLSPVDTSRLVRLPLSDLRYQLSRWHQPPGFRALDASFAMVDRAAARFVTARTGAVLAREDACLDTFKRARAFGRPAIYVLPTAHFTTVKRLIDLEIQQIPDAFCPHEVASDFASPRAERKRAELESATHVMCPSSFVGRSLNEAGVSANRTKVLPFGADTSWPSPSCRVRENVFLYVGNITARKGVHRLIRCWKRIGAYRTHRLRLVGDLRLSAGFVAEHKGTFEHSVRVPREQLPAEYARAEAFVFNALADGFGHVFAEAMVCGTAVLASRNCGAPDLITDGVEGRLFDYGDDDQLATVLDWALSHPNEVHEMGAAARQRALSWGWRHYQEAFMQWVTPLLAKGQLLEEPST